MAETVESHPQAAGDATPVTVFGAIAEMLDELGVERVFGLMGDDTVRLVSALLARGVPYHNARHENAAIAMAAGYASATGSLAVCVISRGPGSTNAVTSAVNADRGGTPVIVITGDERVFASPNAVTVPDAKALDVRAVAAGAGLHVFTPARPESVRGSLAEAALRARTGRTVLFTIPQDVFQAEVVPGGEPLPSVDGGGREPEPAREEAIAVAARLLADSRRPLIVAGHGAWASGARDVLIALADRVGAVLCTTLRGKDMFDGHPYNAGLMGSFSHSAGRRLMEASDLVLAFGASLNRYTTTDGASLPAAPLVQIDADRPNIGRYHWADAAVVGDARLVAEQLLAVSEQRPDDAREFHTQATRRSLAEFDHAQDFEDASTRWAMDPRTLLYELDALLPADRAVVTDNGNFFGFVPTYISVPAPDRFKLSSDFAVIGLGFGTALGAAYARPDVPTVLFIGDGGLLMSLGELETLARLDLPVIVFVINDTGYGAEKHFLELREMVGTIAMFPDVDFAGVAEGFGIEAATVRTVDELRALRDAFAGRSGPLLVDCKVTAEVAAPFLSGSHL